MVPCNSTAEEVSFEWSHHRILSTDSNVGSTLRVSIIDSGVKGLQSSRSNILLLMPTLAEILAISQLNLIKLGRSCFTINSIKIINFIAREMMHADRI